MSWDDWEWEREDGSDFCNPGIVDRWSYRGDSLIYQVQIYQPPPAQFAPQNLTGWFFAATAKRNLADQDNQAVAVSKTTGTIPNIITYPNGASAGVIQVSFGPLNTITLGDSKVRLYYDIQGIDTSGNVTTVERGRWTVLPDVTRSTSPF